MTQGGDPRVVIFGVGAVGGTVGGWIAPHCDHVQFLARGDTAAALRTRGLQIHGQGQSNHSVAIPVDVIEGLAGAAAPDLVVLAVKNYSLESAAKRIREQLGDRPVIVALQNGVANQEILPRFFSRVVYGVVGYNAWVEAPGVIGFQKRGPILLGTPNNRLQSELELVAHLFNRGFPARTTQRLQDAVHSKLILNLTNSFTTLIGRHVRSITSPELVQRILSNLLCEGIRAIEAAGYRECRIGGMPSWLLIRASAALPRWLTRPLFERNLRKMVVSSMAQDVLEKRRPECELDTINGYLLRLADRFHVDVPYNRAVYRLCVEEFAKPAFEPLPIESVWQRIQTPGKR